VEAIRSYIDEKVHVVGAWNRPDASARGETGSGSLKPPQSSGLFREVVASVLGGRKEVRVFQHGLQGNHHPPEEAIDMPGSDCMIVVADTTVGIPAVSFDLQRVQPAPTTSRRPATFRSRW